MTLPASESHATRTAKNNAATSRRSKPPPASARPKRRSGSRAPLARNPPPTLLAAALRSGARILLYKGPDAEAEIEEALPEAKKRQILMRVKLRYDLPDGMGSRTIVELSRKSR